MLQMMTMLDQTMLLWVQDAIRTPLLTAILTLITRLGDDGAVWLLISIGLLFSKKTRALGIVALCSLGCTYLLNNLLLKNLVARIRPYEAVSGLQRLIEAQEDFSFPSGHTASSFAVAVVLLRNLPKTYGASALILAVLIGFSRVYLGVHYPTDVICGALIGTTIAILVYNMVYERVESVIASERTKQ